MIFLSLTPTIQPTEANTEYVWVYVNMVTMNWPIEWQMNGKNWKRIEFFHSLTTRIFQLNLARMKMNKKETYRHFTVGEIKLDFKGRSLTSPCTKYVLWVQNDKIGSSLKCHSNVCLYMWYFSLNHSTDYFILFDKFIFKWLTWTSIYLLPCNQNKMVFCSKEVTCNNFNKWKFQLLVVDENVKIFPRDFLSSLPSLVI